jgi:uncharacterized SAM-binding protein YcdF (DUF218 family)
VNPAPAPRPRLCTLLGALVLALFMVAGFTPAPNLAGAWLGIPSSVHPAGAIVVLGGGGVWDDGMPNNASLRRAVRGIVLYREGLAPLLVFSGVADEIEARVELARELGVPPEKTLAARVSRTTRDEAARLRALLDPWGVRTILLVTDSQHLNRARRLFERAGFQVFAAAADDFPTTPEWPEGRLALARRICGEVLARLYYKAAGYL